jgi:class 3 adenylate cyclase/carbon monoxide dehydrogenase subunit G
MPRRFERNLHIQAPRQAVWDFLAHTDRLNRELGFPSVNVEYRPQDVGGSEIRISSATGPIRTEFIERPFDWVRPVFYREDRIFPNGPFKRVVGGVNLSDHGEGTNVQVWTEIETRGTLGNVAAAPFAKMCFNAFERTCAGFEKHVRDDTPTPYPRHSQSTPADNDRLGAAVQRVISMGAPVEIMGRLALFIRASAPEEVVDFRPFAVADRWQLDRMAVLRACLICASREGAMLDLRWRILCPSCRGNRIVASSLRDVEAQAHCPACNIRYDASFDRNVEVLFSVAQKIRAVQAATFCVGGPGLTPHIVAQAVVAPGEKKSLQVDLEPGQYRVISPQAGAGVEFAVGQGGAEIGHVRAVPAAPRLTLKLDEPNLASGCVFDLQNQSEIEATIQIQVREWVADAATADLVTGLQLFRDQFSSEVLSRGTEIGVEQVCILFSDLQGSTAMYRREGDAPSYRQVRDHFTLMRRIIEEHDGGIVKTIGDAVMATFHDPRNAIDAAIQIQQEAMSMEDGLVVKLGLHNGSAIAVNANDLLDYFGQTVNLAARVQRESHGGDVVLTSITASDPRVTERLQMPDVRTEPFSTKVRGLDEEIEMVRVSLLQSS